MIAHRRRSLRRHRAVLARLPEPPGPPDLADQVAARVDDERTMRQVRRAVRRLPQRDQDVLELCGWAGLDYAAAAAALGIPVGTVRSRLSRARMIEHTPIEHPPLAERDLPAGRRDATRTMLVDQAQPGTRGAHRPTGLGRPTRPASPIRVTRRRLVVASAAATAVLAAAAQLWPLPDDHGLIEAWTPHPQAVDQEVAAGIAQECISWFTEPTPGGEDPLPADGWEPVVVDRRGEAAAALVASPTHVAQCLFHGIGRRPSAESPTGFLAAGGGAHAYQPLPAGQVISDAGARGGFQAPPYDVSLSVVYGQLSPEVAEVVVTLDDGTDVTASVADGWYLAWWPGTAYRILIWSHLSTPEATSVRAYDYGGRLLDQLELT